MEYSIINLGAFQSSSYPDEIKYRKTEPNAQSVFIQKKVHITNDFGKFFHACGVLP